MSPILLIDDDDQFRGAVKQILERRGFEVFEASDGEEGLVYLRTRHFEIVITDIVMAGKEGLETISELKRDYPDVQIIAMSGGSLHIPSNLVVQAAKALGAARVFKKPFDLLELAKTVEEIVGKESGAGRGVVR